MVSCPRCGGESPSDSKHCVHCGHPMEVDAVGRTSFGMPQVKAQGPNTAAGAATTRFGADDLARLAAAAAEAGLSESAPAEPAPAPAQSLLAGLPRPRVSSAPSPLTAGRLNPQAAPTGLGALPPLGGAGRPGGGLGAPPPASARSTVMGMPVLGGLGGGGGNDAPAEGPTGRRAGIASLDSFDMGGPPSGATPAGPIPAGPSAPVAPSPGAADQAATSGASTAGAAAPGTAASAGAGLSLGKGAGAESSGGAQDAPAAASGGAGLSLGKPSADANGAQDARGDAPGAEPSGARPAPSGAAGTPANAPRPANAPEPGDPKPGDPKPGDPKPGPAPSGGAGKWIAVALVLAAAGAAAWYFFGRG